MDLIEKLPVKGFLDLVNGIADILLVLALSELDSIAYPRHLDEYNAKYGQGDEYYY